MKFFYANNFDHVNAEYDWATETRIGSKLLPHEYIGVDNPGCYSGMLISMAHLHSFAKKSFNTQGGLRKQSRWGTDEKTRSNYPLIIDSGAFTYVNEYVPPIPTKDVVDIYVKTQCSHALALDHIPLKTLTSGINKELTEKKSLLDKLKHKNLLLTLFPDFDPETQQLIDTLEIEVPKLQQDYVDSIKENERRLQVSQQNAEDFLRICKDKNVPFTPIATAHGWDEQTYEESAYALKSMGYSYIAIGGLVPIASSKPALKRAFEAVNRATQGTVPLHVFGIGSMYRFDYKQMKSFGVESFDSASPIVKSISGVQNYFGLNQDGKRKGYMALKVPHISGRNQGVLNKLINQGEVDRDIALQLQSDCLQGILSLDTISPKPVQYIIDKLVEYATLWDQTYDVKSLDMMKRTLTDRPWQDCDCRACKDQGAQIVIFRGGQRASGRCCHNIVKLKQKLKKWEDEA